MNNIFQFSEEDYGQIHLNLLIHSLFSSFCRILFEIVENFTRKLQDPKQYMLDLDLKILQFLEEKSQRLNLKQSPYFADVYLFTSIFIILEEKLDQETLSKIHSTWKQITEIYPFCNDRQNALINYFYSKLKE